MPINDTPLATFEAALRAQADPAAAITAGLVGADTVFQTPYGCKKMIYADYVASGRALHQIETFVMEKVLPFYANSHTEASFTGATMTRMREDARKVVAKKCNGNLEDHAVVFAGSGATAALNKLVHLLGVGEAVARGQKAFVLVGPYEHHSNLLPWRESGAEVIEIAEAPAGGPDLDHLRQMLARTAPQGLTVAAFSAASNVTGICSDIAAVTKVVKQAGAKMVWDYAGGGPYLPIDMSPAPDAEIDAIALSPHKFIGGPGASGVLVLRRDAVTASTPSQPGGGTVAFVNAHVHDYAARIEDREEGGTPNIIGDIRAALVLIVKDVIGQSFISARNEALAQRGFDALRDVAELKILGGDNEARLPIFSFIVRDGDHWFDYQTFTTMLSDHFGIQARGGCSCAGPYVHRLLEIDDDWSNRLRAEILAGDESHKPGFIRLNLSYLMQDDTVDFILSSVAQLARTAPMVAMQAA